ncbi:hypothetical protein EAE96_004335 [Botrytis aclada]|nr:hypothetical protein EAE96_004335 [Botrytis aclada]
MCNAKFLTGLSPLFQSESPIDSLSDEYFPYQSLVHQLFPPPEKDVLTFPKFKLLPPELQVWVFKEAVPDRNSRVADFYFKVCVHNSKFLLSVQDEISPASHLLPLLNACKLSRKVVYSQLKQIMLSTPDPHGTMRKHFEDIPVRHFWVNDRRLVQTYIDPVRDTLMLNIPDLMLLYYYRRSIDLSKIERLAIATFPIDFNMFPRNRMIDHYHIMADISEWCPDIKVLQIVLLFSVNNFAKSYRLGQRRGYHVIDIDTEMRHDDYWDNSGCLIERPHMDRIESVLNAAKIKSTNHRSYLRLLQEMKKEKKIEFWKKVKLTNVLLCELDVDSNWETLGKKAPEPRLYSFSFDAWILAHEDGSPLSKYKGLAQIFEGAPW